MAISLPPPQNPSSGDPTEAANPAAAAIQAAPAPIWRSSLGSPPLTDNRLLAAVSDIHRRVFRAHRRPRPVLPLPIHPSAAHYARNTGDMPIIRAILEDIVQHTLSNLHTIQKSLLYWQSRAKGTNSQKMYFMIFERGPRAFAEATCQMLTRLGNNRSPSQYLLNSASDLISTKLADLTSMRHCLAAFLAEVYSEVSKCREGLTESSDESLHILVTVLNTVFSKLEISLRNAGEGQTLLSTHDGNSSELLFERLPEVDVESSQWIEALSSDAISFIYQNLQKLDSFVTYQLSRHKKPRNMTIYWLPYTCGAIGLSACSLWLLCHSSLVGSSDMDNWIQYAKESVARLWDEHVEKPVISLRDVLFEPFKQTDELAMRKQEVQLAQESLCRYEKALTRPIQNVFNGELHALLIQIQKNELNFQKERLAMDQLLKADEKRSAILAALPAFGLSLLLLRLVGALAMHDHEGRRRIARRQRMLLLGAVEKKLMEFQICVVNGMEEEASCKFGLALYTLDRLYEAVESHAKETGEWSSVREDIFDLATPNLGMADKVVILSRLREIYTCICPR